MTVGLSQAPHPSTSSTPAHYSPLNGYAQAGGHGHQWLLYTSQYSPPAGYSAPTAAFVPLQSQPEFRNPMGPAPTTSSHPVYGPDLGTSQYSYLPPPLPPQQNFRPDPTPARAPRTGYQYARPLAQSNSGSSSIIPSGLMEPLAAQQSDKYKCTYCGKCFTRPSSLKVRLLSLTHVSEKKELK